MAEILSISGGATAISGLAGAATEFLKHKQASITHIGGVSAGALIALPLALDKWDEVRKAVLEFDENTIWSRPPVKKNGRMSRSAFWNLLRGRNHLAKMDNLPIAVRNLVSEDEFYNYQKSAAPKVFVMSVNLRTGQRKMLNLWMDSTTYEDYIQAVVGSCSLPLFSDGSGPEKEQFDGGLRDHSIGYAMLEHIDDVGKNGQKKLRGSVKSLTTIYSRPDVIPWSDKSVFKNLASVFTRTMDILMSEVSKSDEMLEELICKHNKTAYQAVHLPVVMEGMWDFDPKRKNELYRIGQKRGEAAYEKSKNNKR